MISLDPPLKQGNTRYPYLTIQFHKDDEIDIELEIENPEDFKKKYGDKINKEMSGPLFQVFTACLKNIASTKIHTTGDSWSNLNSRHPCMTCSYKANLGALYPLEKAFMYVVKPRPIYIRFEDIQHVLFAHGGKKNFEFQITLRSGEMKNCNFESIDREDYPRLFKFCQQKKIRIKNIGKHEQDRETVPILEGGDITHQMLALGELQGSSDESEDEDFDLDDEYQKESKRVEKDHAFEEDSGSGGSSEFSGSEDEDYDGDDVINMDDEDDIDRADAARRKRENAKRNRKSPAASKKAKQAKNDPNAPKRPLSAFFAWLGENREKLKAENPDAGVSEIGKLAGEKWRDMAADEKEPYETAYKKKKEEYEEAMRHYVPPEGMSASVSKKVKRSKDPNAPKKPMSAYFRWMNENREKFKGERKIGTFWVKI